MKFGNKKEFYSLRKFKGIGLASALVGLMFLGSTVKADETVSTNNTGVNTTVVANIGEVHPEHGKLTDIDDQTDFGWIGYLYEDGTYLMKASGDKSINVMNPNEGVESIFGADREKLDKIKNFKIIGNLKAKSFYLESYFYAKNIDLTGLTLPENAHMPMIAKNDTVINNVIFDPNFNLSNVKESSRLFSNTPNLKLTNEQVSQLLNNTSFSNYTGPIFETVGVEKLDLSSFDNSKLKRSTYATINDNHLFVNLIGLKEIVFGNKFDFNNYKTTNDKDSFFDTNLSTVERVTFEGNKENNSKFIKDWLLDVKKHNVANAEALYHDGKYVGTVDEIINSDKATYEDGIYTLGVNKPNKPEDKTDTEIIEPEVEYVADNTRNFGTPNERVEGEKGTKTTVTTYEWDEASKSYKEKQLEPVIKKPTKTIIKVGTKSKVEEKEIPFKVEYKEDKTISSIDLDTMWKLRVEGKNGKLITTTTYSLNTQTGEVTENTTTSIEKPVNEFRVIGLKPEVTTEVISITTKYEEDKTKEAGTTEIVNPGKEGKIITTINFRPEYSGDNNEFSSTIAEEPVIDKTEMIQKVVKVGTKPKVTTEVIPITTKEEKDDSKVVGTSETINPGKEGKIVTTTPYILNEKDGTVKEGTPIVEKTEMVQKVVKVGTHPASEVPNEAPIHELPEFNGGVNPNEAPSVELPEFNGGVNPNEAPSVDVPEFNGGVNPNEAPSVDIPEFGGGVNPNEAPSVELPEFNGGVNPNEAPVHDKPEFNGDLTKEEDKSKDTKNKKSLPNTGMASGSIMTLLGGLSFAGGLGLSRKKKED